MDQTKIYLKVVSFLRNCGTAQDKLVLSSKLTVEIGQR